MAGRRSASHASTAENTRPAYLLLDLPGTVCRDRPRPLRLYGRLRPGHGFQHRPSEASVTSAVFFPESMIACFAVWCA
jgi:hypothetical protein